MSDTNNDMTNEDALKFDVPYGLCSEEIFDLLERGQDLATSYVGEAYYFENGSNEAVAESMISLQDKLTYCLNSDDTELSYLDKVDLLSALSHTYLLLEFESSLALSGVSHITDRLRLSLSI